MVAGMEEDPEEKLIEDQILEWREDEDVGMGGVIELICEAEEELRRRHSIMRRCAEIIKDSPQSDPDLLFDLHEALDHPGGTSNGISMVGVDHHGEAELSMNVNGCKGSVFISREMWESMTKRFTELSDARCKTCWGIGKVTFDSEGGWRDPCPECSEG